MAFGRSRGLLGALARRLGSRPRVTALRHPCFSSPFTSSFPSSDSFYSSSSSSAASSSSSFSSAVSPAVSSGHTRFSYFTKRVGKTQLLDELARESEILANPHGHDAVVVLATPGFAKSVDNAKFMAKLARLLAGSADAVDQFHVLFAVVDRVAPANGAKESAEGISILRGRLDDTLPGLWNPSPLASREYSETVAALEFDIGRDRSLTLPLAQTTFCNNRVSTLVAMQFRMTGKSTHLCKTLEKKSQRIVLPRKEPIQYGEWTPLKSITPLRRVTGSFGNIIKTLSIGGVSSPASTELEASIQHLLENRTDDKPEIESWEAWALVMPESYVVDDAWDESRDMFNDVSYSVRFLAHASFDQLASLFKQVSHMEMLIREGGRYYRVVSGGGGWGNKKGLLSLDPQKTHRLPVEEDTDWEWEDKVWEMQSECQYTIAPPGHQVQFYLAVPHEAPYKAPSTWGIVFGVPHGAKDAAWAPDPAPLVRDHFGALSSEGLFFAKPAAEDAKAAPEDAKAACEDAKAAPKDAKAVDYWKVNIPGYRFYLERHGKPRPEDWEY